MIINSIYFITHHRTVIDSTRVGITVSGVQDGALAELDRLLHTQVEAIMAIIIMK